MTLWDTPPPPEAEAHDRGMEGSNLAGTKWTQLERLQVDFAIRLCAKAYAEFTADEVWGMLGQDFLVTKGLAGRLNYAAKSLRIISGTGRGHLQPAQGRAWPRPAPRRLAVEHPWLT